MSALQTIAQHLPYVVSVWVFGWGLWGVVSSRHMVHMVISVSVMQTSTYVLLLAIGYKAGGIAPIFVDRPLGTPAVDPVVQALMLTDVVVEATVLALLLAIVVRIHASTGKTDPDALRALRG